MLLADVMIEVFKLGRNLRLEVESAYNRCPNPTNQPNLGRKMGFNVILLEFVDWAN
jgi:hypothetical protein